MLIKVPKELKATALLFNFLRHSDTDSAGYSWLFLELMFRPKMTIFGVVLS